MDMDSLLVSLTLSFFISISYVSPILLWQFANNIREREYHHVLSPFCFSTFLLFFSNRSRESFCHTQHA